jgi:hypothetical protein
MANYPTLSIESIEGCISVTIHLTAEKSIPPSSTIGSFIEKLHDLKEAQQISNYHFIEFLKKANEVKIKSLESEPTSAEPYTEDYRCHFEKNNPYSEKACIKKIVSDDSVLWRLSGPNFCSDPFTCKESGYSELKQLKDLKNEVSREEIKYLTKLLIVWKEIPEPPLPFPSMLRKTSLN